MVWEHETAMNTTRTTLRQALSRWRRRFARALLLMGALACMAFYTVAYGQITPRLPGPATTASTSTGVQLRAASPATTGSVQFQAAGTAVWAAAANVTPAWPTHAIDDIALLFIESTGGQAAALSVAAGFAAVTNSPQATGTTTNGTRITVYWARATSTAMAAPTVTNPGNHVYAQILTYRGAINTGNPWEVTAGGVKATASTSVSLTPNPTVTTTFTNELIVQAVALDINGSASAPTNANLTGITVRSNAGTALGNAGGFTVWDALTCFGAAPCAGATGAVPPTTATVTSSVNAFLTIALKPAITQLTVTKPAGTVAGDVMVAHIGFRANCCGVDPATVGITFLDGWTYVRRKDAPAGQNGSLSFYWKVAGASEPDAYRWTFLVTSPATFDAAVGGILSFTGANPSIPTAGTDEDVQNTPATSYTSSTPSLTTSADYTMLVTAHAISNNDAWAIPPPSGLTQAYQQKNAGAMTIQVSYGIQPVAGPTGAKAATDAGPDAMDSGNAHIFALRPALFNLNKHSGLQVDDVMIASISVRKHGVAGTAPLPAPTPPAGWTLVTASDNDNEFNYARSSLYVYYRRADASDTPVAVTSYGWNMPPTALLDFGLGGAVGGIQTFSGVITTGSPIDGTPGAQCTPQGTASTGMHCYPPAPVLIAGQGTLAHTTPNITTLTNGAMVVTSHAFTSSATWTSPGGTCQPSPTLKMCQGFTVASLAVPNGGGISMQTNYEIQPTAGATVGKTATASNDADAGNAHVLALKPQPTAATPGRFNAVEPGANAITGVIKTKIAGANFTLDIVAIKTDNSGVETGFNGDVKVQVYDGNPGGTPDATTKCSPSWTLITTSPVSWTVTLAKGIGTLSNLNVANAFPNARVRVAFPATGAETTVGCSADNFAIRPNTFASYSVTDGSATTPGTTRTLANVGVPGGLFHNAGQPFTVKATAMNAAGTPAPTTSYVGTPTATLTNCAPAGNACTATFGTFTLGGSFAAGVLTSNAASYGDVGSFNLQLVDSTFSNVDLADGSTTAERNITSAVMNVGRFVPDHFAVAYNTAPPPTFGTACAAGGFTYVGQAFNYTTTPVITVTAQNATNGTTTRYTGALWQITNASLTGWSYTAASGTLNTGGITGTDPVIVDSGGGAGTLTFGSGTGLLFTRTTPVATFNADISLAINVIDLDGVAYATNPARFGAATAGNGIAFSSGKPMRFGRLAIRNANGSQLLALPVPLETQYWSGTAFVTNDADNCTTLAGSNVMLSNPLGGFTVPPGSCTTSASNPVSFSNGRGNLIMVKPSGGAVGSVDLAVNLGTTAAGNTCVGGSSVAHSAANKTYLQGAWTGGTYTVNPSARATFGVYKGSDEVIFIRENF